MTLLLFSCAHAAHGCSSYFPCCFDLNFHSAVVSSIRMIMMLRVLKRALPSSISFFFVHTSPNCDMYVGAWLFIFSILCTAEAMPSSRTHTIHTPTTHIIKRNMSPSNPASNTRPKDPTMLTESVDQLAAFKSCRQRLRLSPIKNQVMKSNSIINITINMHPASRKIPNSSANPFTNKPISFNNNSYHLLISSSTSPRGPTPSTNFLLS